MTWLISIAGGFVVAAVLRDVFHTLFHPSGEGSINRQVLRGVWRAYHWRSGRDALVLAGPAGFLAVVATWTVLLIIGFALVYWPHLDTSFAFASALDPATNNGFLDAVYFSATALATLGYGDIAAATTPWRLIAVLQGLIGLALLTAAVSWLLSIYAALQRRRTLAGTVSALTSGDSPSPQLLENLANAVASARTDLMQHSAVYYFHSRDVTLELAATLPALGELSRSQAHGARTLAVAIAALAQDTNRRFLHLEQAEVRALIDAWTRDHRVTDEAAELVRHLTGDATDQYRTRLARAEDASARR